MEADIRKFKPLREDVRGGLTTLLVQARQIWGPQKHTLDEIVVRLMVGVGDIARVVRDKYSVQRRVWDEERGILSVELSGPRDKDYKELKKELGNVLFSTIRWIDDLGFDPLECLDLAIEAQESFAKSGRPR